MTLFALTAYTQTNYAIPWFKIAGGGAMQSTGGVYTLSGTIGQVDTGRVAATNVFRIEAGFWAIAIQQLGYPTLDITRNGDQFTVSWITAEPGFMLQTAASLAVPTAWTDAEGTVVTNGTTNALTFIVPGGTGQTFYRLRRP